MNIAAQYQILEAMGINLWLSREDQEAPLVSLSPLFCAGCLVLLPEKLSQEAEEQHKILTGMLKVLELNKDSISVAWLRERSFLQQPSLIIAAIQKWAPFSVLILGESLAQNLLQMPGQSIDQLRKTPHQIPGLDLSLYISYHPDELMQNKENKRKAMQDLLNLKEHLKRKRSA